ncbi:MAG: hypothetical protein GMKNLPBB_01330 [Myxococcota bacterium]|nr:hypothetical protein [Myxococcota bacterium]
MPIYVYEHVDAMGDQCPEAWEELESMSAEPLAKCPWCGLQVRRAPTGFHASVNILTTRNIKEKGFTTLVRKGKGHYVKV